MTLTYGVMTINPEDAEVLLARNINNRPVSLGNVSRLAKTMNDGDWVLNGEAIKIAEDSTILDGQHRLLAVVQSGATIKTLVIRDLPKATQESMDQGKSRNAADALSLGGAQRTKILAAVASRLIKYEAVGIEKSLTTFLVVTTPEIIRYVESHPALVTYIPIISKMSHGIPLAVTDLAVLRRHLFQISQTDADYFFNRLHDGIGLQESDPILVLRNNLLRARGATRLDRQKWIALTIKAWNKFRASEKVSRLNFATTGPSPEPFPEAI